MGVSGSARGWLEAEAASQRGRFEVVCGSLAVEPCSHAEGSGARRQDRPGAVGGVSRDRQPRRAGDGIRSDCIRLQG